jgi:CubicO group peptidase (beta-lactamase class C family)
MSLSQQQRQLEEIRAKYRLPALAAVAVVEGRPQAVQVVGVRKWGGSEPVLPTDAFHLGSDTKAMTAALIGLLVDQGKLTWRSTLGELLPETPSAWRATTIEQLLAHRAGLTDDEPKGTSLLYLHRFTGPLDRQRARWYSERLASPPDATVGKYQYANAGYTILGVVAERLAGRPWEQLMMEALWRPLGITGGGFGAPPLVWQHLREAKDSEPVLFDPREKVDNPPLMGPAGRVHLPLGEWAKFIAVFADPERQRLLRPETLSWLMTPTLGGEYNGGWVITSRSWASGRALTHAGSNTMNFCSAWVAPKRRLAVLFATTIGSDDSAKACDAAVGLLLAPFLKTS